MQYCHVWSIISQIIALLSLSNVTGPTFTIGPIYTFIWIFSGLFHLRSWYGGGMENFADPPHIFLFFYRPPPPYIFFRGPPHTHFDFFAAPPHIFNFFPFRAFLRISNGIALTNDQLQRMWPNRWRKLGFYLQMLFGCRQLLCQSIVSHTLI